jgi:hypothetical protein
MRMLAAFVVLIAQVGVAGASVLDAREGASAASHLEQGGTNLHFAHNEADCFLCRAQHIGDATPFNATPLDAAPSILQPVEAAPKQLAVSALHSSNTSRAPPSRV